jgi:hypothetical protein
VTNTRPQSEETELGLLLHRAVRLVVSHTGRGDCSPHKVKPKFANWGTARRRTTRWNRGRRDAIAKSEYPVTNTRPQSEETELGLLLHRAVRLVVSHTGRGDCSPHKVKPKFANGKGLAQTAALACLRCRKTQAAAICRLQT